MSTASTGSDAYDGLAPAWDGTHGPKLTIQGGIGAALGWTGADHTVNVAAGTYSGEYNRGLAFGEAMTIIGEKPGTGWSTVIDCDSADRAFAVDADVTIDGFSIINGSAENGGGIYWTTNVDVIIKNCEIKHCEATDDFGKGGGIYCIDGSITLEDSVIWTCHAGYGGGIYATVDSSANEHNPLITNCEIKQNWADVNDDTKPVGGGIFMTCLSGLVADTTVSDNSLTGSPKHGGGIYIGSAYEANATLLRCTISGNSVVTGAGGGIYSNLTGVLLLKDCLISENHCGGGGGGVYSLNTLSVTNCEVSENGSEEAGGGISGCTTVANSLIWSNVAQNFGGGMIMDGADSAVVNTIVAENRVTGYSGMTFPPYGGGVISGDDTFTNCVFYGNEVQSTYWSSIGGGVYGGGNYYNSIIWSNTATYGSQIAADCAGYSPTLFNYCDVQGGVNWSYIVDGSIAWTYNISSDPDFVAPESMNFRLSSGSPCIDSGWNSAPAIPGTDKDGNLRIAFGETSTTVDMGAYEYNSSPWVFFDMSRDTDDDLSMEWTSVATTGQQYVVYHSYDEFSDSMEWSIAATVDTDGATTSWEDTNVPTTGAVYYKVMDKTTGVFTYDCLGASWIGIDYSRHLISSPFEPYPEGGGTPGVSTLDKIVGDQLTGHPVVKTLSDLCKWWNADPNSLGWSTAWYKTGSGWEDYDTTGGNPMPFTADTGYWIYLTNSATTVLLFGKVPTEDRSVTVYPDRTYVGTTFPVSVALDDCGLIESGFTGHPVVKTLSDQVLFWNPSSSTWDQFWYKTGVGFQPWNTGDPMRDLQPGEGIEIMRQGANGFTWDYPKPYSVPPNTVPEPGNN